MFPVDFIHGTPCHIFYPQKIYPTYLAVSLSPIAVIENIDFLHVSSKAFLNIQATLECGFTLKRVRDMIWTYNQMQRTNKYSQHGSFIKRIWLNGWVFLYEVSGCGFEFRCNHLKFRFPACFEQGVPWH